MAKIFGLAPKVKYPQRRSRSSWLRRETPEGRRRRTQAWRGRITASVAEARSRQLPLVTVATWLRPVPPELPDPGPARIPADQAGRAIAGTAVVDAYFEARRARES